MCVPDGISWWSLGRRESANPSACFSNVQLRAKDGSKRGSDKVKILLYVSLWFTMQCSPNQPLLTRAPYSQLFFSLRSESTRMFRYIRKHHLFAPFASYSLQNIRTNSNTNIQFVAKQIKFLILANIHFISASNRISRRTLLLTRPIGDSRASFPCVLNSPIVRIPT